MLLRKPGADQMGVEVAYTGFDIGDEFVVGYGLDYAEQLPEPAVHRDPGAARLWRGAGPDSAEGNTISDR